MNGRPRDFDLHGLVGIRLIDAGPHEVATVERQLGPLAAELRGPPDITIRFVDRLTSGDLTYCGVRETGFDADGFFVLQGRGGVAARTLFPFDRIGRAPEIICERGVPAVPHLVPLVNLTALAKGVLALHASAFTVGGIGVLVTGWSKGGKTESLVGACLQGAEYVGDEWVYLTTDGRMYGVPEPIRLWAWQLRQLPDLLRGRRRAERLRLRGWQTTSSVAATAAAVRWPGAGVARRGAPIIARQAYLQVPPAELFGPGGLRRQARLDVVVLLMSHSGSTTTVSAADPGEVAQRMTASLAEERVPFMSHYRQFRYAFPHRASAVVEDAGEHEARLLSALLAGRPAATISHPYPCDIRELGRQVMATADDLASGRRADEAVSVPW